MKLNFHCLPSSIFLTAVALAQTSMAHAAEPLDRPSRMFRGHGSIGLFKVVATDPPFTFQGWISATVKQYKVTVEVLARLPEKKQVGLATLTVEHFSDPADFGRDPQAGFPLEPGAFFIAAFDGNRMSNAKDMDDVTELYWRDHSAAVLHAEWRQIELFYQVVHRKKADIRPAVLKAFKENRKEIGGRFMEMVDGYCFGDTHNEPLFLEIADYLRDKHVPVTTRMDVAGEVLVDARHGEKAMKAIAAAQLELILGGVADKNCPPRDLCNTLRRFAGWTHNEKWANALPLLNASQRRQMRELLETKFIKQDLEGWLREPLVKWLDGSRK